MLAMSYAYEGLAMRKLIKKYIRFSFTTTLSVAECKERLGWKYQKEMRELGYPTLHREAWWIFSTYETKKVL
jgi:hypothetical protein